MDEELKPLAAPLELILRELPIGVLTLDSRGELQLANLRAEELLGRSFDEIAASLRAGAPDDPTSVLVQALLSVDRLDPGRFELRRDDGTTVMIEGSSAAVRSGDRFAARLVTLEDVTARERRRRAERDFVTNAAHELQTPLAAITSAVQVLQAGAKDQPADRDRFLAHVERACARLERLTRALLVLAHAQTREEAPRREIIPLAPMLAGIAEAIGGGARVAVECADDLAVVANRALLEQALANVGQNAVKHTAGAVVVTGKRIDGRVEIRIRDEGPGIDAGDRESVFDRFYRTGGAAAGGFGLGLAIVAEAVKAIEGELELDSSPGGTSVSIALPAAKIVST